MNKSWNRIYEAFHQAMQLPREKRLQFVQNSFDGDQGEVEQLHRLLQRAEDKIEDRLAGPAAVSVRQFLEDSHCDSTSNINANSHLDQCEIGAYRLVNHLGTGGMGEVYLAERKNDFHQQVALKLLRSDLTANRVILRRFELERELLSELRHENIAQLFDGGKTDFGNPYFVMEYVDGIPITNYCREHELSLDSRIRLFQNVCRAVSHAHHFGVVHRDIKPANILVTPSGVPKLLDFGIARLTETEALRRNMTLTEGEHTPFTPAYASPEQFKGEPAQVASDVYSLGVVLYELLAGVRPFDTEDLPTHEIARLVCERQPTKPSSIVTRIDEAKVTKWAESRSRLRRRLCGDLDQIVLKTLRSDQRERYSSVEAVEADLQNYFEGRPVVARRGTTRYLLGKFLKRNAVYVSAAVVVMIALVGGLIGTTIALRKAKELAEQKRDLLYQAELSNAQLAYADGQLASALQILIRHIPSPGSTDLRGFEWYLLWKRGTEHVDSPWFPDVGGEILALSGSPPSLICTSATENSRVTKSDLSFQGGIPSKSKFIDFATSGNLQHHVYWRVVPTIACAFEAGLVAYFQKDPITTLVIADLETGEVIDILDAAPYLSSKRSVRPGPVAFSPDATLLASRHENGTVMVWRIANDRKIEFVHRIDVDQRGGWQLAFSPDGSRLAATSNNQTVRLWDTDGFHELHCLSHSGLPYCICWSPDSARLITGTENGGAKVWDTNDGKLVESFLEDVSVQAISFSPDGRYLAVGGKDRIIRLLSLPKLTIEKTFLGHNGFVESIAFTPDSNWLLSGDDRDEIRFWRVPPTEAHKERPTLAQRSWQGHKDWITGIAFHPKRNIFATAGHDERVHIWDGRDGRRIDTFIFDTWAPNVAFSPSGDEIATGGTTSGESHIWDFSKHEPIKSISYSEYSAFHPSGKWFAESDPDLRIVHYPSMANLCIAKRSLSAKAAFAWANKSPVIAFAERNGRLRLGRIEGNDVDWQEVLGSSAIQFESCKFSPSDKYLVLGDLQGSVHWFEMRRGEIVHADRAHFGATVVAFSPDASRLATAGQEGTVKLWDVPTRRHRLTLKASPAGVNCIDFSADGQVLAAGGQDGMVHFWRAATQDEFKTSSSWVREQYTW